LFKARARGFQNYRVNCVANVHDYIFLKLAQPSKDRTCLMVAVSLYQYPEIEFEKGEMIRLHLTDMRVAPMSGHSPHQIASYIEKLDGTLCYHPQRQRVKVL
jgi:hypothetical protein